MFAARIVIYVVASFQALCQAALMTATMEGFGRIQPSNTAKFEQYRSVYSYVIKLIALAM